MASPAVRASVACSHVFFLKPSPAMNPCRPWAMTVTYHLGYPTTRSVTSGPIMPTSAPIFAPKRSAAMYMAVSPMWV